MRKLAITWGENHENMPKYGEFLRPGPPDNLLKRGVPGTGNKLISGTARFPGLFDFQRMLRIPFVSVRFSGG